MQIVSEGQEKVVIIIATVLYLPQEWVSCEDFVNAIDTQGGFMLQWKWRTFFYGDFVKILKMLLTKLFPYPIIIIKMEKVDFSMEILWISEIHIAPRA